MRRGVLHRAGSKGWLATWLLLPVVITACGRSPASAPQPSRAVLASVKAPHAPPSLRRLTAVLQDAYTHGDWNETRAQFANQRVAASLVSRMQMWKGEDIGDLTVSLDYAKKVGTGRYVATFRLGADARTVPDYEIFLCSTSGNVARILNRAGTIAGTSYQQADWTVTRTGHFIVYHSPYQLAGADRSYLTSLEHQRALFAQRFKVRLPPLAYLYLYPSRAEMRRLTRGACGGQPGEIGCTSPYTDPPTIQTTLPAIYHEPIHVYELGLVPPPSGQYDFLAPLFIGEGTAVALKDRKLDPRLSDYCSDLDYAPLDECARNAVRDVDPVTILSDRGFNHADAGDAYALGGSFVKYLILHGGYPRFGQFYYHLAGRPSDTPGDYDAAAQAVYRKPIRTLLGDWKRDLCRAGC